MSIRIKRNATDWCGRDGRLAFKGTEYNLPLMTVDDLKILDVQVKEDKQILCEILEIEGMDRDSIKEVRCTIGIRKRQLAAIIQDFLRRKKLVKPLESFAFSAVYELLGPEVMLEVKAKAKDLQDKYREQAANRKQPKKKEFIPYIEMIEERMCGDKIKHQDKDSGNRQIESMKANGKNTRGVNVYGPCPFCGFFHVGHKPKGAIWKNGLTLYE